jgi:hypothetical protein
MRAQYVARRFGFRPPRGFVALCIIIALLAAGAFWVGPFRPRPSELKLVALSGDGRFREYVGIPSAWADTMPPASEATARFPLILAVHNAGTRTAHPEALAISLPSRFRVTDSHGAPLPSTTAMGNPLVRFELPLHTPAIEPGRFPTIITAGDTIWLEAVVPAMYCTARDSVPEFESAPAIDPKSLSRIRAFYSFDDASTRQRQTGLLTIQLDPNLVKRTPAPQPPVFETQVIYPEAPRPAFESLKRVGSRTTRCGDPGQPVEVYSALWETPEGGRFFVLYYGGSPRKYMFDINRDSIIEMEMWDRNGDGKFESRRAARMAIPAFLMPYPELALDSAVADSATTAATLDSVTNTPEWQRLFYNVEAGPLRFSRPQATRDSSSTITKSDSSPAPAQPSVRTPIDVPANVTVDTAWLRTFNNTDAGPFRFYKGPLTLPKPVAPKPRPRPRQTGPRLLGVPVDSIRR